jgi:acyl-CoA synthetase (AMP-forming)/AMP-acid ligase II
VLSWLSKPAAERGVRFARGDSWEFWSYQDLAELTTRMATGVVDAGVPRGTVVANVQRAGPDFIASLFGTMLAGCVPCPIAPRRTFDESADYAAYLLARLRASRPAMTLVDDDLAPAVTPLARAAGAGPVVPVGSLREAGAAATRAGRPGGDLALLQFTSGSSAVARAVAVRHEALAANVRAIRGWLEMTELDPTASWLPPHHDMGLVGTLVAPVATGCDLWLMQPEQFVRDPARYLSCFGVHGARLTAMPAFGLAHVVRRTRPEQLDGMDFREWRAVIVGAERIDPKVLVDFHRLLGPHGLAREAVLPAYGLAEATLAVTGLPLRRGWRQVWLDAAGRSPEATAAGRSSRTDGQAVVGCGRPLGETGVEIRDPAGAPLPEAAVGEIIVRGPSVAGPRQPESSACLAGGVFQTGDAGFVVGGELFVLGRLGDGLKLRGRTLFSEDLEAALAEVGVPSTRVTALLGHDRGNPTVVALFERPREGWLTAAGPLLRRRAEGARVVMMDAPVGAIARTRSGKPMRRLLWRRYVAGQLPGTVVPVTVGRPASAAPAAPQVSVTMGDPP